MPCGHPQRSQTQLGNPALIAVGMTLRERFKSFSQISTVVSLTDGLRLNYAIRASSALMQTQSLKHQTGNTGRGGIYEH